MKYASIAIIRLSSLGDIIHTLPAFSLLRKRYPQAKINWIVEPTGARLLQNFSGIDATIVLDLKTPGLRNKFKTAKTIISKYRKSFDLILDFQGLLKSAVLAFLLKGRTVGFHKKNLREPLSRYFYKERAESFAEDNHVIFKNIHLVKKLAADNLGNLRAADLEYPLKKITASKKLHDFLAKNRLQEQKFLILNIGGGWDTKILEPGQYIDIINQLKDKHKIAVLWGNEKERQTAARIAAKTGVSECPFLGFSDLILLIKYSRFIITGDTLALHIADMVKTPSVGIFGPTSPLRNGSLLQESTAVYETLPCSFCYKKKCGTIECIKRIDPKKIVQAIEKIDEEQPG